MRREAGGAGRVVAVLGGTAAVPGRDLLLIPRASGDRRGGVELNWDRLTAWAIRPTVVTAAAASVQFAVVL